MRSRAAPAASRTAHASSAHVAAPGGCGRGSAPSSRARRRRSGPRRHAVAFRCREHLQRRAAEEPQVEAERPAARVGDVHVERLAERRVRACGDLPEPGDARPGRGSARSGGARRARPRSARHGRGPTSDMSPRITLISCGSSSRLVRRSQRPTRVTASLRSSLYSPFDAQRRAAPRVVALMYSRCAASSVSTRIVRNLRTVELAHVLAEPLLAEEHGPGRVAPDPDTRSRRRAAA